MQIQFSLLHPYVGPRFFVERTTWARPSGADVDPEGDGTPEAVAAAVDRLASEIDPTTTRESTWSDPSEATTEARRCFEAEVAEIRADVPYTATEDGWAEACAACLRVAPETLTLGWWVGETCLWRVTYSTREAA